MSGRRDHRPSNRKVPDLIYSCEQTLTRRVPDFSPDHCERLQARVDGAENTLYVGCDQIFLAYADHRRFSSLAYRCISEARSGSSLRSNRIPSVW